VSSLVSPRSRARPNARTRACNASLAAMARGTRGFEGGAVVEGVSMSTGWQAGQNDET
jgi:hypothetical protein